MPLATTSRAQLRYIKETTYGVTPVVGNGRKLRMIGESLNYDLTKEQSKEIRSDRSNSGATTVDADANGGLNFHMQYAEYDQLVEAALQSLYVAHGTNGVGTTFTAAITTTTITASVAPTGSSAFTLLQQGQWFRLLAPTDANNGKLLRVSATVAPTSTVITLDAATPGIAAASVANSVIQTSRLTNGVTQMSFSVEKEFGDVAQFFTYTGMNVNKMGITFGASALTDCTFDLMGKSSARFVSTQMPGTIAESQAYEIQNAVRGVSQLWEGTAPLTGTFIKSMTVNVDNTLRGQKAIGNLGSVGIGNGDFMPSGTMEIYFASGAQYDKFLNDTYTQIIISTQDTSGNGYVYTFPRVLLMNAKVMASGKNQDVMVSFDYTAFSDDANAVAALRKTMFIDRVGLAVT